MNYSEFKSASMRKVVLFILFTFLFSCKGAKQTTVVSDTSLAESSISSISTISSEIKKDAIAQILDATWTSHQISKGIIYKYYHFNELFDSKQSVTVIKADLSENVKVDIPYVTSGFIKTSEIASQKNATAAINGSFFNMGIGGSTVFFKSEGKVINFTLDSANSYRENAGFSVCENGKVSILKKPDRGWHATNSYTLLTSGPLLVFDGKIVPQENQKFNTNRHPRTAVGIDKKNNLIAVVVDGRSSEAHGMSTEELAVFMQSLGCTDAMNLDGGGSSTAWVEKMGVVNYPSDNKKFDHAGERNVADVITFTQQ